MRITRSNQPTYTLFRVHLAAMKAWGVHDGRSVHAAKDDSPSNDEKCYMSPLPAVLDKQTRPNLQGLPSTLPPQPKEMIRPDLESGLKQDEQSTIVPRGSRRGLFASVTMLAEIHNPYLYSKSRKWFITFVVAFAAAATSLGSAIIYREHIERIRTSFLTQLLTFYASCPGRDCPGSSCQSHSDQPLRRSVHAQHFFLSPLVVNVERNSRPPDNLSCFIVLLCPLRNTVGYSQVDWCFYCNAYAVWWCRRISSGSRSRYLGRYLGAVRKRQSHGSFLSRALMRASPCSYNRRVSHKLVSKLSSGHLLMSVDSGDNQC